jgi:hypothetical protein
VNVKLSYESAGVVVARLDVGGRYLCQES